MIKKYAVFIDGDNISSQYLDSIFTEISKDGSILIKRIYGDWTTTNMNSWKEKVFATPIRIFQQFRFGPNATDNSIIMDAIEMINLNKDINSFCIVSTDSDYYSLALRLRENGKYVLGIGKENSKDIWKNSCDKFILLENINKVERELQAIKDNEKDSKELIDIDSVLKYALDNSNYGDDGWIALSNFAKTIYSRYPSFDPRTYNHKTLLSLVQSFSKFIDIKNDDRTPPNYWIHKKSIDIDEKQTGTIKRFLKSYGFIENEQGNFFFTLANISKDSNDKKLKKGARVKFKIFKKPDLTKEDSNERNGRASEIEIID